MNARPQARRSEGHGLTDEDRARTTVAIDDRRQRIDELDEQLVALLSERAACALEIGRLKQTLAMEIYQPARERAVLAHVRAINPGPLDGDAMARLFERIIDEARRLERIAHDADGPGGAGESAG